MPRRTTAAARLARLGFADPARAELLLTEDLAIDPGGSGSVLVEALAAAADPDLALAALARMPRDAELARLTGLGASVLGDQPPGVSWIVMADPEGNEFCLEG